MKMRFRRHLLALALLVSFAVPAWAVTVSPSALYIDHRTRSGTLTLVNTGSLAEEIEINFMFGYPRADSLGNVSVQVVAEAPLGEPSLVPYLRAFPRRLRLEPGQRQVVRIFVQPPAGLAEGEYWGRIAITSRGGQAPIEQQQGEIRLQVNVETVVISAVTYRNGTVTTGVELADLAAQRGDSSVRVAMTLKRTGNAAYLGRLRMELVDAGGTVVAQATEDIAVYRDMQRIFTLHAPAMLAPGAYTVRYAVDVERPDLPPEGPLPAPQRTGTIAVR
jgi:fimbrial chaperone protein